MVKNERQLGSAIFNFSCRVTRDADRMEIRKYDLREHNGYPAEHNGYPAEHNGYPTEHNGYPQTDGGRC